jgi:hypothetical protein
LVKVFVELEARARRARDGVDDRLRSDERELATLESSPMPIRSDLALLLVAVALVIGADAACGGRTTDCADKDTRPCTCPGNTVGAQACQAGGGAYLACDCRSTTCADHRDLCGAACCDSGAVCVADLHQAVCGVRCNVNSECPADKGCCANSQTGEAGCIVPGSISARACFCATAAECSTGVCGEIVDPFDSPLGQHLCVENNGAPYSGCNGGVACPAGFYCMNVAGNGSNLCEKGCQSTSECGPGVCVPFSGGAREGVVGTCQ